MDRRFSVKAKSAPRATNIVAIEPNREASWLTSKVEQGRHGVFCEIVDITPELANRMLEVNIDNRKPKQKIIDAITLDIEEGRWQLNGETIVFSEEGPLNDGQNRLFAIAQAGATVQSFVVFGAARRSRFTVDMGAGRSAACILELKGVSNATMIAAVGNLHLQVRRRDYGAGRIDRSATAAHAEKHKDDIVLALQRFPATSLDATTRKACAAAYMLFRNVDPRQAEDFFEGFTSGAGLGKSSPILAVRNRMLMGSGMREEPRRRAWHRLELLIHHWNKWRARETVAPGVKLQITSRFPEIL